MRINEARIQTLNSLEVIYIIVCLIGTVILLLICKSEDYYLICLNALLDIIIYIELKVLFKSTIKSLKEEKKEYEKNGENR